MGVIRWRAWAFLVFLQVAVTVADVVQDLQEAPTTEGVLEARKKDKKKMKYAMSMSFILGIVVIKVILIPLALKAVSFVAGKAFLMSALSLILSAILGFRSMASHGWDRMGQMMMMPMRDRGEVTETYHPIPTQEMYHKYSADQHWSREMKE